MKEEVKNTKFIAIRINDFLFFNYFIKAYKYVSTFSAGK